MITTQPSLVLGIPLGDAIAAARLLAEGLRYGLSCGMADEAPPIFCAASCHRRCCSATNVFSGFALSARDAVACAGCWLKRVSGGSSWPSEEMMAFRLSMSRCHRRFMSAIDVVAGYKSARSSCLSVVSKLCSGDTLVHLGTECC